MALGAAAISSSGGGGGSVTQGTSPWIVDVSKVGGSAITLGQALAASSLPVVLTAAQLSTLTPLASVAVTNTGTFAVQADTELPAAAALADSIANPTLPSVGNFNHVWGQTATTWARQKHIEHGLNTSGTGVAAAGMMAEFDDTSPTTTTENQFQTVRMSSRRELYTQIRDAGGNERGANVDANSNLGVVLAAETTKVIGTVNVASSQTIAVTQATASSLNATVVGTGTFAVQATPVTQIDTFMLGGVNIKEINAATPLMGNGITGTGSLRVTIASDNTAFAVNSTLSAETTKVIGTVNQGTSPWVASATLQTQTDTVMVGGVNIKEINAVTPLMGAGNTGTGSLRVTLATDQAALATWGLGATAAAVPSGSQYQGGQARSSEAAAATNANLVGFVADLAGKQIVLPYANPENFVSGNATATDTTSTSLIAAPASGLRNYITTLSIWNSSASSTYIKIQDGSGGTTIWQGPAPAGGGSTISFPTPLKQPTTATAIFFAANASANAVFISAAGYKGA